MEAKSISQKFGMDFSLKGNSAEGNPISGAVRGISKNATPARDNIAITGGGEQMSPFIKGDNKN